MKLIQVVLAILSLQIILSINLENRRKRAMEKEKRMRKNKKSSTLEVINDKASQKSKNQAINNLKGGDFSFGNKATLATSGSVKILSLVPMKMVRRKRVRYIIINLVKIKIVNCLKNFEAKFCHKHCLEVGFPTDTRCLDCQGADKNKPACQKQEEEKSCKNLVEDKSNGVYNFNDKCCEWSMVCEDCLHKKNRVQQKGCCELEKYKDHVECSCDYILNHQSLFTNDPNKVTVCCQERQKAVGYSDQRCSQYDCKTEEGRPKCCALAYAQPKVYPQMFSSCCAQNNNEDKRCKCEYKLKNLVLYNKDQSQLCCADKQFKDNEYCIDCTKQWTVNQKCCQPYMEDSTLNADQRTLCCKNSLFANNAACKEECKNNRSCCDQAFYKNTEFCNCYHKIDGKPLQLDDLKFKKCFCMLNPENDNCIDCSKDFLNIKCCNRIFASSAEILANPSGYESCCNKFKTSTNCQCKEILKNRSQFPRQTVTNCCKNDLFNPDSKSCCEHVRDRLSLFSEDTQKTCCDKNLIQNLPVTDSGKNACCQKYNNCEELYCTSASGNKIDNKCCAYYNTKFIIYPDQFAECCKKGLLVSEKCDCKYVFSNINTYNMKDKIVQQCCDKPLNQKEDVCIKCDSSKTPNEPKCCPEIVNNNLKSYSQFGACCKETAFKDNAFCQKHSCETDKTTFVYGCCESIYFKDIKVYAGNYNLCCQQNDFKNKPECLCKTVLTTPKKYPETTIKSCCKDNIDDEFKDYCQKKTCEEDQNLPGCNGCVNVFKNPFSDLAKFDKCCQDNSAQAECQCQHLQALLVKVKSGSLVSEVMKKCCSQANYFSNPQWNKLGCSNCPFNTGCCKQYFKNQVAYQANYGSDKQSFLTFVSSCCRTLTEQQQLQMSGCSIDCKDFPTHVSCCNKYTVSSPADKNFKECCANDKFLDPKQLCGCSERLRYPKCCSSNYNENQCCTGKSTSNKAVFNEYAHPNTEKCCKKFFNLQHCCQDFSFLDSVQKTQCCESDEQYQPGNCCSILYKEDKCCATMHRDSCCKSNSFYSDTQYKKNCCSESLQLLNLDRSDLCKKVPTCTGTVGIVCPPFPCTTPENCNCPDSKNPICPVDCNGKPCLDCWHKYKDKKVQLYECQCKEKAEKGLTPKNCFCYLNPDSPSCQCTFQNIMLNPNLLEKCCQEDPDKCKCYKIYNKYRGPKAKSNIQDSDVAQFEKCCDTFYPEGFCYKPGPYPPTTCSDILKKGEVDNLQNKFCCAWVMVLGVTSEQKKAPEYTKCCDTFGITAGFQQYCHKAPEVCTQNVFNDDTNPKKAICCKQQRFKDLPECDVCKKQCVYQMKNGVYHKKYSSCCTKDPAKCCISHVFDDPASPIVDMCCSQYPQKCCQDKQFLLKENKMHEYCCTRDPSACCPNKVMLDVNHPDHNMCCKLKPTECTPVIPPDCTYADYLNTNKNDPNHIKCCNIYYIPNLCPSRINSCNKILSNLANKETPAFIQCCKETPIDQKPVECIPPNCEIIFATLNKDTPGYSKCCDALPKKCPPSPECYPETVYTDENAVNHKSCCSKNPLKCYQPPCTISVFQNIQNPFNENCCFLYPDVKECQPIPIPCVNDKCVEEKDEQAFSEEYFNKDGLLAVKSRMKKKNFFLNHNHSIHHFNYRYKASKSQHTKQD